VANRLKRVLDPITAKAVLAEKMRRDRRDGATLFSRKEIQLEGHELDFIYARCHEKQKALLKNPARFKALLSPRRVGKTTYNLFEVLVHDRKYPRSYIAYVVPDSKAHAKDLFWIPMKELDEKLHLGLTFKEVEKRVITPGGTNILILGAHDADSPIRLRGNPWSLVLLDECKDFGSHFTELVVEAALPGLDDYGGTLCMSGTPGNVFEGLFYQITTECPDGWEVARWIKSDNTFLRPEARDLKQVWESSYKPFGLTMDSPKFRREQLAEWVADESEQAYYYSLTRNVWDGKLSENAPYDHICGIDLGKRDKAVIQPACFSEHEPWLTYLEAHAERGMYIETIYQKWKEMDAQYHFAGTVVDTGGLGVMIVDDINMRYGCNWQAAQKGNGYKLQAVEQMNNDFLLGKIRAEPSSLVAKAWMRGIKDPRTGLPKHCDESDAALYVHRFSYHWMGRNPDVAPAPNSPEWWNIQEKEAVDAAIKNRKKGTPGYAISDDD
jgi:hypothetical protein